MATREIKKNRSKAKLKNSDRHILSVTRSNKHIQAQVFDPKSGKTLFTVTSAKIDAGTKTEKSVKVGETIVEHLKKNNISSLVFDRNGFIYHGRIKALVEAVRNSNIEI
jgi:large subunit ribosomal protein L18